MPTYTKEEILSEIKRTAKENGGKHLGMRRFFHETGIKVSDWRGIHWANWGKAVKEVGFKPYTLQKGFGKKHLINKYIELIKELKRFPVQAELSLKHNDDKNFPSPTAFARNLGQKSNRLARILEFCETNEGYGDVIRICKQEIAKLHQRETTESDIEDKVKEGWVYLAKIGKKYKIGHTYDLARRLVELRNQSPEKVDFLHEIKTDDPPGIEKYWHDRKKSKKIKNEFFNLIQSDVKQFKRWRKI